jgi:hypothetical protein
MLRLGRADEVQEMWNKQSVLWLPAERTECRPDSTVHLDRTDSVAVTGSLLRAQQSCHDIM